MKKQVKGLVLITVLALLAGIATFIIPKYSVGAASKAALTADTVQVATGGTVSIPVNIVNNPGVVGFDLKITYPEDFTLTGVSKGDILLAAEENAVLEPDDILYYTPEVKKGYSLIGYAGEDNATGDGTLFVLSFQALADCAEGTFQFTVNPGTATGSPGGLYTVSSSETDINEIIAIEKDLYGNLLTGSVVVVEPERYSINVTDHTGDNSTETDILPGAVYSGQSEFTVTSDGICAVAVLNPDGSYTRLLCTDNDGVHTFTVDVTSDIGIALVLKGDADLDGDIKSKDATIITKQLQGTADLDGLEAIAADVDEDDTIKGKDATIIIKYLSGTGSFSW